MTTAGKNSNVITLRVGSFLQDLEADLKNAEPWSEEKTHYLWLLAQYLRHPNISQLQKTRALQMNYKYNDMSQAITEAGYERAITLTLFERENLGDVKINNISWVK